MEMTDGFAWVENNRLKIIRYVNHYRGYAPYDMEDYMQNAYLAAVEALEVVCASKGRVGFPQAFWVRFRAILGNQVPHATSGGTGSRSIPRNTCVNIEDYEEVVSSVVSRRTTSTHHRLRLEALRHQVIASMAPLLTEREMIVLAGALGSGPAGYQSNYEMARVLGCVVSHVRTIRKRMVEKLYAAYGFHGNYLDKQYGMSRRFTGCVCTRRENNQMTLQRKPRPVLTRSPRDAPCIKKKKNSRLCSASSCDT